MVNTVKDITNTKSLEGVKRLRLATIYSKENRKEEINNVNKFYKVFLKKYSSDIGYYKTDLIKYWVHTEVLLRKMFKYEFGKKCKTCISCCCSDCEQNGGHFSSFDYFMYKLRGFKYPGFKKYLGKRGCTIKKDRRSFTCLFYTCIGFPLSSILRNLWEKVITNINESVIEGSRNNDFYNIFSIMEKVLEEISDKYNPLIEVDKKLLDGNTRKHLSSFKSIRAGNVFNQKIQDSAKYIIRLLEKSLREV